MICKNKLETILIVLLINFGCSNNDLKRIDKELYTKLYSQSVLLSKSYNSDYEIIVLFNYSCPYCKPAINYLFEELDNATIRLVNIPKNINSYGYDFAILDYCYSNENFSETYYKEIFSMKNFRKVTPIDIINKVKFKTETITKCYSSNEAKKFLMDNIQIAKKINATYTPFIVINGFHHEGTISNKIIQKYKI